MRLYDRVLVDSRGNTRAGMITWIGDTGMIVSLFYNQGSLFFGRKSLPRGACFNTGGYSVRLVK